MYKKAFVYIWILIAIFMIIILSKNIFFYLDNTSDNVINYKDKKNAVGIINIPGTSINEIIMQGDDNEYYLNHDNDDNYNVIGSIYMDYRNNIEDRKLLIFGHNSETLEGLPFQELEKFTDKNFYQLNKYIILTLGAKKSKWLIFSIKIVSKDTNIHMRLDFDDEEWLKHIDWLKENSLYNMDVDVTVEGEIVILQTCCFKRPNTNLIISAKKINNLYNQNEKNKINL